MLRTQMTGRWNFLINAPCAGAKNRQANKHDSATNPARVRTKSAKGARDSRHLAGVGRLLFEEGGASTIR